MMRKGFAIFVLAAAALRGQSITSSLIGSVHDETGSVVPSATVTAVDVATNARASVKTDATGVYLLL